jgi:chromosome segregation and condensation protein ScpB
MKEETKVQKLKPMIEAALFMTNEPISVDALSKMLKLSSDIIFKVIHELRNEYSSENHGVYIFEAASGYQMKVKPDYAGTDSV